MTAELLEAASGIVGAVSGPYTAIVAIVLFCVTVPVVAGYSGTVPVIVMFAALSVAVIAIWAVIYIS